MKIQIHLAYYSHETIWSFRAQSTANLKIAFMAIHLAHAEGPYHNFGTQAFCRSTYRRFMYRCAGWFALTLVCLPWKKKKKNNNKKANLTKNQQLAIRWCLMEGSLLHWTEAVGIRVHEVEWLVASVGKHLVPSLRWAEWLFWEWDLLDKTLSDV